MFCILPISYQMSGVGVMVCEKTKSNETRNFALSCQCRWIFWSGKSCSWSWSKVVFLWKFTFLKYQRFHLLSEFVVRKDWIFYDQALQAVAILDKKLKIFIFIFFVFNSSYSKILPALIFSSALAFQQY